MYFSSLKLIHSRVNDTKPEISILVRMKNESLMLPYFLNSLDRQSFTGNYEVIFLDSGSTDLTISFVKNWKGNFKLYSIDAEEFSFSKSCNFLVECARADICIFLSAHVEIIDMNFLDTVFSYDKKLNFSGGYFRQVVNHNNGYSLYDVISLNKSFPRVDGVEYKAFNRSDRKSIHFSNAASVVKKQIAIKYPFPNVIASEDALWANTILNEGYEIYYFNNMLIAHSHDESYAQITKRVKINKTARYGDSAMYLSAFTKFIGVLISLLAAGEQAKTALNTAIAHAKGYL